MSDFQGFQRPTTTPVPDEVFDVLLPTLSEAELKVLLYIIRRTLGFGKSSDDISLSQIESGIVRKDGTRLDAGTGLSRRAVIDAVEKLVSDGIITKTRNSRGNLSTPSTYVLLWRGGAKSTPPVVQNLHHQSSGVVQNLHRGSVNSDTGVVQNLHTQETVLQETGEQETAKTLAPQTKSLDHIPDAANVWDAIKGYLELSITQPTFDTWIKPARAASFEGGVLTLVAPSSYAQDWLAKRLSTDIERAARQAVRVPVTVKVIVGERNGRA